jgi:NAD(P)H-hydrate epimerase
MRVGMANAPYEVLFLVDKNAKEIVEESEHKAHAMFIGPGLGREENVFALLKEVLSKIKKIPLVLDADALFFLAKNPKIAFSDQVVFTPHKREMERFFEEESTPSDLVWIKKCQKFCDERKGVLIVKGAPSFVFSPHQKPFVIARGDPGMATAGTGDVLTGIISSLLAQKCSCLEAVLLGSFIHGLSGEIAAGEKTSYSVIASDLIDYLSKALHVALRGGGILYTK